MSRVQCGRCWSIRRTDDPKAMGFEHPLAGLSALHNHLGARGHPPRLLGSKGAHEAAYGRPAVQVQHQGPGKGVQLRSQLLHAKWGENGDDVTFETGTQHQNGPAVVSPLSKKGNPRPRRKGCWEYRTTLVMNVRSCRHPTRVIFLTYSNI